MKTALKVLLGVVLLFVLASGGVYGWASMKSRTLLSRTIPSHTSDFPIPFPLAEGEVEAPHAPRAASGDGDAEVMEEELAAIALERAVERGRHLVEARCACTDCHGPDFGGGVMVDDPMIGRLLGPNITSGEGGRTAGYGPADWDRIVRHGLKPDGTPAAMPSQDFARMSDQELSDIVAYIRTLPPVDATVEPPSLGPLGKVLVATGKIPLSADLLTDHQRPHAAVPPSAGPTLEFGEHLAGVCVGCHGADFAGGPVPGGDPSWPAAANVTPHEDALGAWTYDQFASAMRTGKRPDGTELRLPMSMVTPYAQRMEEVELQALWMYLQSVPARATEG